jgi:hypothetical protein
MERGQEAIERPKAQMEITLSHGKTGLTVRYQGKAVTRIHASEAGKRIAPYVAEALGVGLPPVGGRVKATVSSGVMFRVLSISSLDLRWPEADTLLLYLLDEAEAMRGFKSAAV